MGMAFIFTPSLPSPYLAITRGGGNHVPLMSLVYKTKALILSHQPIHEADVLLTLYTDKQGKVQIQARGARKIKSKLAGSLQPLTYVELLIASGRKVDTVTSSKILNNYSNLRKDLVSLGLVNYIFEIVIKGTHPTSDDKHIFDLLINFLDFFDRNNSVLDYSQKLLITNWCLLHFFDYLGYAQGDEAFVDMAGVNKMVEVLSSSDLEDVVKLKHSLPEVVLLNRAINQLAKYIIERDLVSERFVKAML